MKMQKPLLPVVCALFALGLSAPAARAAEPKKAPESPAVKETFDHSTVKDKRCIDCHKIERLQNAAPAAQATAAPAAPAGKK